MLKKRILCCKNDQSILFIFENREIHEVLRIQTTKKKSHFLRGLSTLLKSFKSKQQSDNLAQPKFGQSLFMLHHQTDLTSVIGGNDWRDVTDMVMMDDGRLVMCLPRQRRLLICNTDGSQVDSIDVQGGPWCVTAVNNSTVAVTLEWNKCIEMYDINNKLKLKSISVPEMWWWMGNITTINNKLVVCGCDNSLLIIDHQTGEVVQTIQTDCYPDRLHGSGDRLFYCDNYHNSCTGTVILMTHITP
ncbi:unnamed protein product [Mytilus edulis]|uniref:Uncharacterized protein n=1 Tax=Mytilus edulis TaxID=6550 RepID=A0A8S3R1W5_MYTED|nr:unnamed protein product [Mytilus edulis]